MAQKARVKIVRQLRRGQITIPREFREELDIAEDSLLLITLKGRKLEITPVEVREEKKEAWLKALYDLYAPVREDLASRYSPEEIDRAIDEAVEAARKNSD